MGRKFALYAFTPSVKAIQKPMDSRESYQRFEEIEGSTVCAILYERTTVGRLKCRKCCSQNSRDVVDIEKLRRVY